MIGVRKIMIKIFAGSSQWQRLYYRTHSLTLWVPYPNLSPKIWEPGGKRANFPPTFGCNRSYRKQKMLRFELIILPFLLSGCASSTSITDSAEMILVPPVAAFERSASIATKEAVTYETTECIPLHRIRSTRIIDRIGIAYEMPNREVWLNRPKWGASILKEYLVMITRGSQNRLCSGDIVRFMDSSPAGLRGAVALGPFVRYPASE